MTTPPKSKYAYRIDFNWYVDADNEPKFETAIVGNTYPRGSDEERTCIEIIEHFPQGEGDKYVCTVRYSDGSFVNVYNPNTVEYLVK